RYGTVRASAGISGPLNDTLGFSLQGSTYHTKGPFKSITTGESVYRTNNDSLRARFFYDNGPLTADLKFDYFENSGAGISYNGQIVGVPIPPFDGTALDVSVIQPFVSNVIGTNQNKFYGGTLKLDYDVGAATLTSITGLNKFQEYFGGDGIPYVPNTGQPGAQTTEYLVDDTNFSQELRITSNGNTRLRWQVGAYFLSFKRDAGSRVSEDNLGTLPPHPRQVQGPNTPQPTVALGRPIYNTKDYALFANVQYDILDTLTLSLAGRYDIEKRSVREAAPSAFNTCVQLNNISIDQCRASKTFKIFSPKATLSYHPDKLTNFYVSYGKGFKSGGFNPIGSRRATLNATPPALQPFVYVQDIYAPEKAESWEAGAKLQFGELRLNGAAFKTKVKGAQQFAFFPTTGLQTVVSIDEVDLKGFDLGLDWTSPIDTGVTIGVGYVDGKITKFAGNPGNVGNVAPGSAEYTLFVGVQQPIPLDETYQLVPRVEFNRYGRIWWDADNTPGTRRAPMNLVNARLTLKSESGWQIGAWMDNVFNKKYYQEIVPLLPVISVQFRGWTRSFGMDAKYAF
ncbi:MAG: TonB-dependent receptor, partial [Novosphingobium sp.]